MRDLESVLDEEIRNIRKELLIFSLLLVVLGVGSCFVLNFGMIFRLPEQLLFSGNWRQLSPLTREWRWGIIGAMFVLYPVVWRFWRELDPEPGDYEIESMRGWYGRRAYRRPAEDKILLQIALGIFLLPPFCLHQAWRCAGRAKALLLTRRELLQQVLLILLERGHKIPVAELAELVQAHPSEFMPPLNALHALTFFPDSGSVTLAGNWHEKLFGTPDIL